MMLRIFYLIMAVTHAGNGLVMLAAPESWYERLVPGVPHTGPMNLHFERDIGLAFLSFGVGLGWAAFNLKKARPVHLLATIFIGGHGLFHVEEIIRGGLPFEHWALDAPGVFLPSALMLVLCIPAVWRWANPDSEAA